MNRVIFYRFYIGISSLISLCVKDHVFQGADDFVAGFFKFVPLNISGGGADHHPGQEQLADLMEGHTPDEGLPGGLVIVVEHFGEIDRGTAAREIGAATRLGP